MWDLNAPFMPLIPFRTDLWQKLEDKPLMQKTPTFSAPELCPSWFLYRAMASFCFHSQFSAFSHRPGASHGLPQSFWILVFFKVSFAAILHTDNLNWSCAFGANYPPNSGTAQLPSAFSFLGKWLAPFFKTHVHCYCIILVKGSIAINRYM